MSHAAARYMTTCSLDTGCICAVNLDFLLQQQTAMAKFAVHHPGYA